MLYLMGEDQILYPGLPRTTLYIPTMILMLINHWMFAQLTGKSVLFIVMSVKQSDQINKLWILMSLISYEQTIKYKVANNEEICTLMNRINHSRP